MKWLLAAALVASAAMAHQATAPPDRTCFTQHVDEYTPTIHVAPPVSWAKVLNLDTPVSMSKVLNLNSSPSVAVVELLDAAGAAGELPGEAIPERGFLDEHGLVSYLEDASAKARRPIFIVD